MICRFLLIILSLITLSGCADGTCLDADDFGFAHFVVPARYDSSKLEGQNDNQVAPWLNTGYVVNGQTLVVVVKNWNSHDNANTANELSAWCPWYGGNSGATGLSSLFGNLLTPDVSNALSSASSAVSSALGFGVPFLAFSNGLSKICQDLAVCQWSSGGMCTDTVDAQIINAPCLLTQGVGLYALITGPGANPNSSIATKVNPSTALTPSGIALHVGALHDEYTLYDVSPKGKYAPAGGVVYNYNGYDPAVYNNGGLYFKILDKHYGDNSGQYLVTVKSGLDNSVPDPIQFVTNMVAQYFFGSSAFLNNAGDANTKGAVKAIFDGVIVNKQGIVESMYQGLIQNPFYKNAVRSLLSLYVIFTGLYYLAGLLHLTTREMIARIIKIAIVATLLDPNLGWSFFHDNLFVFFIEGVQEIIHIIQTAAATGPGSGSIISLMLASQTLIKLFTLLFASWFGWIYIILYFFIFCFIVSITLRAAVLYLNCLIIIGMIIIMGPIFLCFMLFSWTKGLFENWLRQLISYAIQPIILITSLAFVSILVRHEIYATLGFPVCKQYFLSSVFNTIDPTGTSSSIFSWWFPSPMNGDFSDELVTIPVPEAHNQLDSNGNPTGVFCGAYACNEQRYVQLPFLDPKNPADMVRKRNFFEGAFTQITGLIYIVLLCYLLSRFNESAVSIARALTETSGNETSMDRATQTPGFMATTGGFLKALKASAKFAGRAGLMYATRGGSKGDPVGIGVGGKSGSKDDGAGTFTKEKVDDPLAGKGFKSLDEAKTELSKPLELKNMPKPPPSSKYNMKDFDKSGFSKDFVKKSGAKDDFDVRLSDKKLETAKPSPSLEDDKAKLKALKPIELKKKSLAADKVVQNVKQEVAQERKMSKTGPAKSEVKFEVTEARLAPKVESPSVVKQEVSVSKVEKALPPPPPPPPLPPPLKSAAQETSGYMKSTVLSRAKERPKSAPSSARQEMKVSSSAPSLLENKSEPSSPRSELKKSSSAPAALVGKSKLGYMDHTKSSAQREKENLENRARIGSKSSPSTPRSGSSGFISSPRSSSSDLSVGSQNSSRSGESRGSNENDITRSTVTSRANEGGGKAHKAALDAAVQKEKAIKEKLSKGGSDHSLKSSSLSPSKPRLLERESVSASSDARNSDGKARRLAAAAKNANNKLSSSSNKRKK